MTHCASRVVESRQLIWSTTLLKDVAEDKYPVVTTTRWDPPQDLSTNPVNTPLLLFEILTLKPSRLRRHVEQLLTGAPLRKFDPLFDVEFYGGRPVSTKRPYSRSSV